MENEEGSKNIHRCALYLYISSALLHYDSANVDIIIYIILFFFQVGAFKCFEYILCHYTVLCPFSVNCADDRGAVIMMKALNRADAN